MTKKSLSSGTAHSLPKDMYEALLHSQKITDLWEDITPLARNEFICWVEDAKQEKTRKRRIKRTVEELLDGQRRPCCWAGCIHRSDKKPSKWQSDVLLKKQK